jgi:transposase
MSVDLSAEILNELADLRAMLAEIRDQVVNPREAREWYSVDEVAGMLGKSAYTVRQWCNLGRLIAAKRAERRGGTALWSISTAELARYKNEGLLPIDPERNNVN